MSSAFISASKQNYRKSMLRPETGKIHPSPYYHPQYRPVVMPVSKVRKNNPYQINQPHHSYY